MTGKNSPRFSDGVMYSVNAFGHPSYRRRIISMSPSGRGKLLYKFPRAKNPLTKSEALRLLTIARTQARWARREPKRTWLRGLRSGKSLALRHAVHLIGVQDR